MKDSGSSSLEEFFGVFVSVDGWESKDNLFQVQKRRADGSG